jgi:hypothetical protein
MVYEKNGKQRARLWVIHDPHEQLKGIFTM